MTEPRPGDAFQPGDVLNNTYRIERLLGRGGTSDVYRACNEISGRLVAIKVLKAEFSGNDDYLVLMTREEEIREIRHDAIVRYSENHRTSEGLVYLVMDYIDGKGLDAKLKEGPMPAEDLLAVCRQVGDGLRVAHSRSIVHRDLSPDNIILRDDDPAQAIVIDFGIAKDTNPGAETIVGNEFAGKYAYAAPEQLSGQTDARADIYSLGALLLANFRGKAPNIGANPMEVVQKKSEPLDTSGVPEPLKTLLDRMTAPDLNLRFQSMDEVLNFLDSGGAEEALSDATIIAPPPKPVAEKASKKPPAPKRSSGGMSGGLIAAAAAVVVLGGGAAAFFGGLFGESGPVYPPVSPYSLTIRNLENFDVTASGFVPSPEMQNALVTRMDDIGGTLDVTLASGEIAPTWGTDVLAVLDDVTVLDNWELSVTQNNAAITGTTDNPDVLAALSATYPANWPGALSGTIDVVLTSLFLDPGEVDDLLAQMEDCGPLYQLEDPGTVGYGENDVIRIGGALAGAPSREAVKSALDALANGRPVSIEAEQLNESLCLVENFLPAAPNSGAEFQFRDGETGQPVPGGIFLTGQNPVIDLVIPADVTDGYLSVSVLDVSGNVYHILPNIGWTDNSVENLREGRTGNLPLRVAYSLSTPRPNGRTAFTVDDTLVGKSKVMAVHSQLPLFEELRPSTESASGYAEALAERAVTPGQAILSIDNSILTTAKR